MNKKISNIITFIKYKNLLNNEITSVGKLKRLVMGVNTIAIELYVDLTMPTKSTSLNMLPLVVICILILYAHLIIFYNTFLLKTI